MSFDLRHGPTTAIDRWKQLGFLHVYVPGGVLPIEPFYHRQCTAYSGGGVYNPRSAGTPIAHVARCQDTRINGAPCWGWVLRGAVVRPFLAPAFPTPA